MLNETNVRCFLVLSQCLSFTETARRLYMTQQAVSKHIARMEYDLGFALFERDHHSVALTPAGSELSALMGVIAPQVDAFITRTREKQKNVQDGGSK